LVVCVLTAVVLYIFVACLAIVTAIQTEPRRRIVAAGSILVFFIFGWFYVVSHFTLQSIAFFRVFIWKSSKWEVTTRLLHGTSPLDAPGSVGTPAAARESHRMWIDAAQPSSRPAVAEEAAPMAPGGSLRQPLLESRLDSGQGSGQGSIQGSIQRSIQGIQGSIQGWLGGNSAAVEEEAGDVERSSVHVPVVVQAAVQAA